MANTWRYATQAVLFTANKAMIDIHCTASGTRYIRIYRIYHFNACTASATGAVCQVRIYNQTGAASPSSGTLITAVAHNAGNSGLETTYLTGGTGRTITAGTKIYRGTYTCTEEIVVTTLDSDMLTCLVPFALLWDTGYLDANVQPLTILPSVAEGYAVLAVTAGALTAYDYEIEFTDSAS